MFLRIREFAGWGLVIFGLYLIMTALSYVTNRQVVEASAVVFASAISMRAGVMLVRLATAARICTQDANGKM